MTPSRPHLVLTKSEKPKDITSLLRAEIEKRDWSACHVWADRQRPVYLPDIRKVRRG